MSVLQGAVYTATLHAGETLAGAAVTATVTAPDGTVAVRTDGDGVTVDGDTATLPIQATQAGVYLIVWTLTGSVTGAVQDQFTVKVAAPDLMSLTDLRDELNIATPDPAEDVKLRRWLRAATQVIQNVTGPIVPETRTDLFDGGIGYLVLPARWVSAVTAVTETIGSTNRTLTEQPAGQSVDGYTWDRTANILHRRYSGGIPGPFPAGLGNIAVTYTAGLTTIPDDIQLATAELIRHWYRKTEVPTSGFGFAGSDDSGGMMPVNYMLPNAVMELLERWKRPPEVA